MGNPFRQSRLLRPFFLLFAATLVSTAAAQTEWTVKKGPVITYKNEADGLAYIAATPTGFAATTGLGVHQTITGTEWKAASHPLGPTPTVFESALDYANGSFFMTATPPFIGEAPAVFLRSTNGTKWTKTVSNAFKNQEARSVHAVTASTLLIGGSFLSDISDPHGSILRSTNGGVTWSRVLDSKSTRSAGPFASHGSVVVALTGDDGKGFSVYLSRNQGATWSRHIFPESFGMVTLTDILYANGRFFAVGSVYNPDAHAQYPIVLRSVDGVSWSRTKLNPKYGQLAGIAFGNKRFVAIGNKLLPGAYGEDSTAFMLTSENGVVWTPQEIPSPARRTLTSIAFNPALKRFMAVGYRFVADNSARATVYTSVK